MLGVRALRVNFKTEFQRRTFVQKIGREQWEKTRVGNKPARLFLSHLPGCRACVSAVSRRKFHLRAMGTRIYIDGVNCLHWWR
jgi:hypothetical protein